MNWYVKYLQVENAFWCLLWGRFDTKCNKLREVKLLSDGNFLSFIPYSILQRFKEILKLPNDFLSKNLCDIIDCHHTVFVFIKRWKAIEHASICTQSITSLSFMKSSFHLLHLPPACNAIGNWIQSCWNKSNIVWDERKFTKAHKNIVINFSRKELKKDLYGGVHYWNYYYESS